MATVVERATLILAQEGAEVEPVLSAWGDAEQGSVLLLQQEAGETLSDFKRRLHQRLAGFESTGRGIAEGAFVAKSGFGLGDVLATVALLSSLVAVMVAGGEGRVYLCGRADDAHASSALAALADAMRDQVRGTGVEVIMEASPGAHREPGRGNGPGAPDGLGG
ncbi:MAG TPA: hypothetical protein VG963_03305 [Polyangiaceae bacterium]|nr:hypothetical protein [Polyangiaceae bacterium]